VIVAVGIDIIEVERIRNLLEQSERFRQRVFTDTEQAYCSPKKNAALSYAARFAAKEAFLKALGTGLSEGLSYKDIEVVNDKKGKPELNLYAKAKEMVVRKGAKAWHVSLSHLQELAAAVVILET
jgi:holo-[acyl-carrier protein] synthase